MSKSMSGLFYGTSGTKANNADLRSKVRTRVINLIDHTPGGNKKAMAVGAFDEKTGRIAVSFAGKIPQIIHPELLKRADIIGGIGTHGLTDRNIVGVCAEFHVVNKLLLGGAKWDNIRLNKPIRPRTKTEMPYCENCKAMFADLIDD